MSATVTLGPYPPPPPLGVKWGIRKWNGHWWPGCNGRWAMPFAAWAGALEFVEAIETGSISGTRSRRTSSKGGF